MEDYVAFSYRMREAPGGPAGWEPDVVARFAKIVKECPAAPPDEAHVVYIYLRRRGYVHEQYGVPIQGPEDRYPVRLEDIYRVDPEIAEGIDQRYTPRPGGWVVAEASADGELGPERA